jgi:DNA segregation ATPase FtsK/SpoIIIE-like protein
VQHIFDGYSSASYLLEINAGVQISSIQRYKLDIANALNVSNVRINKDLFVYEGKSYLAIESGKKNTSTLAWDNSKLEGHRLPVGVNNFGQTVYWDLDNNSTPHLLVCGATGSGKSVFLRSTIEYALLSGIHEIYVFDPKHEFKGYSGSSGVTVVNNIEDIETQMGLLVLEMEERVKSQSTKKTMVIFDEFADAVANSRKGNDLKVYGMEQDGKYANGADKFKRVVKSVDKSLEENLRILLQKGRSLGFRIIAATQRASTKVITGDAKVNFPVQICFRVPKDIDSIVVLDEPGAESLNGRGDGLIKSPEYMNVIRFQGFYKE